MSIHNLAPFFNTAEFATDVAFAGLPVVVGMYEHDYVRSVGGIGMDNSSRAVYLPNESIPANVIGRVVVINAESYTVVDKIPDDMPEVSVLILEQV